MVDCLLVSGNRESVVGLGIGLLGGQVGCSRNIDVGFNCGFFFLLSLVIVCIQAGLGLSAAIVDFVGM